MIFFRKNLDERQEIETKRVASIAYGFAFIGLIVAIIVQLFVLNFDITHVAGEFIILVIIAVYSSIGYYRRGIWDTFTKPGIKAYLIYSFLGVLLFNAPIFARYFRSEVSVQDLLISFFIHFIIVFPILFALVVGFGMLTKKRQKRLADKYVDEQ